MKNKKEMKGRLLAVVSAAMLFIFYFTTSLLYNQTGYVLIQYLSQICFLTFLTAMFFMLIKYFDTWKILQKQKKKDYDEFEEELERYNEKQRLKKRGFFKVIFKGREKKEKKRKGIFDVIVISLLYIGLVVLSNVTLFKNFSPYSTEFSVNFWTATVLILISVVSLVLEKLCKHQDEGTDFVKATLESVRKFFQVIGVVSILTSMSAILMALGLFDVQKYLRFFHIAVYYYVLVFVIVSIILILIRKELLTKPKVIIPLPFFKNDDGKFNFIEFFEENTGISMRSLWSIKYIRKIAPVTVFAVFVLLWLATGIKQIEPYQQAAVYRLGVLQNEILKPGIHLTLPYPFDKVETYNTDTLSKVTIGYRSETDSDNLWTATHGENEYKLLLGGGEELVSINLRVEYKIKDLRKYLQNISDPVAVMQAHAYELVTKETISRDLTTLLSLDRDSFSESLKAELSRNMDELNTGIEIVSIVLESMHPPLEIASVYQQIISAEIQAEEIVLEAQGEAAVKLAEAQSSYDTAVNTANANYFEKVSKAKSSVAQFMASMEANEKYGNDYRYQKYLSALCESYQKANLVIVGDGIDSSRIYIGSFSKGEQPQTEEDTEAQTQESEEG